MITNVLWLLALFGDYGSIQVGFSEMILVVGSCLKIACALFFKMVETIGMREVVSWAI